ncbi:MAG: hypothetical protein LW826_06660 [Candidatus Jidaibacter sp.]|jgi:F-type H+-transporting ATPase subunit b|nr:hypothetical protein [Candidatus Jidaibacter sp.]
MPQLNPAFFISQIFWLIIVFAAIYIFIAKYFLPRIGKIVDDRADQIKSDIADSERLLAEYKELKKKTDDLLSDARHYAFSTIENATKKAEAEIHHHMAAIEKKIGIDTSKADVRLARSKSMLMEDVPEIAESLKNEILNKLGQNIKVGE